MYGKLINNELVLAPNVLHISGCTICNPNASTYSEHGYKLIVTTEIPCPPIGYKAVFSWAEDDDSIVQSWSFEELPVSDELSSDEALSIILGGAQ